MLTFKGVDSKFHQLEWYNYQIERGLRGLKPSFMNISWEVKANMSTTFRRMIFF